MTSLLQHLAEDLGDEGEVGHVLLQHVGVPGGGGGGDESAVVHDLTIFDQRPYLTSGQSGRSRACPSAARRGSWWGGRLTRGQLFDQPSTHIINQWPVI